jgi:hypothetical protein
MRRFHGLTLLVLAPVLALSLAGCGGGGGGGKAGAEGTPTLSAEEKGRKFAQCMRANGVQMEDPQVDGKGGTRIRIGGGKGQAAGDKQVEAAMSKCRHLMPGADKPRTMSPEEQARVRAFAKCMREHGVDMPDPQDGRIELRKRKGTEKKVEAAERACEQYRRPGPEASE